MRQTVAIYRPRSILQLILIAFVVVTVPLIVALVTAAVHVDRLTNEGQRSVFQAVNATRFSRVLVEHLTAMERSARQYQVLNDPTLLDVYRARREQFQRALEELQRLDLNQSQRQTLEILASREDNLYRRLNGAKPDSAAVAAAVADFATLNSLARAVLVESSQLIGENVNGMQALASRAQTQLFWQALALIPAALIFAGLFIILIIKPLRRLEQGIRQLGDGRFDEAVEVAGPDDVRELGRLLEWMRRRILNLENQKTMLLRHVSHELKTPLTTIREGSDLLNEQVVGPLNAEQSEIAKMLRDNSVKLQRLIEDLLNFSTLQMDRPPLRQDLVQLDRLVREVVSNHKLAAKSKAVVLQTESEPIEFVGDREKLRAVVDNLLSNAVKYSPVKGRVRISLTRVDGEVVLNVQDQGPGIDSAEREKIFEAFYQGQARAKGPVKGNGLGLSIAKEFVKLHNGKIEIVNEDEGAHFRVSLPFTKDPALEARLTDAAQMQRMH